MERNFPFALTNDCDSFVASEAEERKKTSGSMVEEY